MCSHYESVSDLQRLARHFGIERAAAFAPSNLPRDLWPRRAGLFIRRPPEWDVGDEAVPAREIVTGRWGLISSSTRADDLVRVGKLFTFNARSETAATAYTFRNAWRRAQHCIVPAEAVYEPDWRSGKAVATRFTRADRAPLGIAGLWDSYRDADGLVQESFTMLTMNADRHSLFRDYHRPNDEKRMVVILPEDAYGAWLTAAPGQTGDFLLAFPADQLVATPAA